MKFRFWMPLVASLAILLNGCGGGGGGGDGSVRVVNATTDYSSIDFFADTTELATGVPSGGVSEYSTLGDGSYAFMLKASGSTVSSTSRAVTSDISNTLVAYNTNGLLATAYFTDEEDAPSAGTAKFRVYNATYEAGSLDVYVTPSTTDLNNASPQAANILPERASIYTEIAAGSYRLRVTGNGNNSDIRLDVPAITLTDQEIITLIITKTPGGVLVNGLLLNQGGTATKASNTMARMRVVAGASNHGKVSATVNGTSFASNLLSPAITPYQLVTAGALTTSIAIDGTPVTAPAMTVVAGSDTTMLVLGSTTAPTVATINDVNTPSTNSVLPTRLRLVNGLNGQVDPLTMTADFAPIASNIAFAKASAASNVSGGIDISTRLEVTSPTSATALYQDDVVLQSGRVYTLFMLGDLEGDIVGALRLDR